MPGAGIDLEVEIYATKQAHEHLRMKLREELAKAVPTASAISGVKPCISSLKPNRNK
jgi:hypothetical protein